jgi:hypothetical protein
MAGVLDTLGELMPVSLVVGCARSDQDARNDAKNSI